MADTDPARRDPTTTPFDPDDDGGPGHPDTPEGYFGWPEGKGAVKWIGPDGKLMNDEKFKAHIAEKKRKRLAEGGPSSRRNPMSP